MAGETFAEYSTQEGLVEAAYEIRRLGHVPIQAYTPFATAELVEAMVGSRSRLPWAVFVGGMLGAASAYGLQWLLVAYLYPLDVGGRPPHMPLAFFIITFEMGILAAAFTAIGGVVLRGRLFRLHDPVFEVEGIESASVSGHWLEVAPGAGRAERLDDDLAATKPLRLVRAPEVGR